jgi:hypothetical protein
MPKIIDQDRWGICGFVSVLNGLRTAGLLTKWTEGGEVEMDLDEIQTRLYAEILTYLKYLVFTNSPLVEQIEEITEHLRPQNETRRTLPVLITYIEGRLRQIGSQTNLLESRIRSEMRSLISEEGGDLGVTISMTPDAIVDYMRWVGVKNATNLKIKRTMNNGGNLLKYKNCIIGIGQKQGQNEMYNGLEHWIYVDDTGVLNNWGKTKQIREDNVGTKLFGKWAIYITHVIKMGD